MTEQAEVEENLLSLLSVLDGERLCLQNGALSDLPDLNKKKSDLLRRLETRLHQGRNSQFDHETLESYFEQIRQRAKRNTQLLGSALNGARSTLDKLSQLQTGEPVNRTYNARGTNRQLLTSGRKNNLLV